MIEKIKQIEQNATELITIVAPWLCPASTSWLIYRALVVYLDWPPIIALLAAATIEFICLSTTATALTFRSFNAHKKATHPAAPTWQAAILIGLYLVIAISLVVFLEIAPALRPYAALLFLALSVTK